MEEPHGWTGWLRLARSAPWQPVCRHADMGDCHRRLLHLAQQRHRPTRDTFLTTGATPQEQREEARA